MTVTRDRAGSTVAEMTAVVRDRLTARGIEAPARTARLLVGGLLQRDLTAMVLGADESVSGADRTRILQAADRCGAGEPLHRVLGRRDFFGLELALSPDVLDPRPDTEILVEAALPLARRAVERRGRCRILDLGTGSGAIGLALADGIGEAEVVASDVSPAALDVARSNARRLGLDERFHAIESDWFTAIEGRFDLIVSNPPYIRSSAIATLDRQVRDFDPREALDGGADGLAAYRTIADGCTAHLATGGSVAVEIGFDQRAAVRSIFERRGCDFQAGLRDLGGHDRVLVFGVPTVGR